MLIINQWGTDGTQNQISDIRIENACGYVLYLNGVPYASDTDRSIIEEVKDRLNSFRSAYHRFTDTFDMGHEIDQIYKERSLAGH